MYSNVQIMLFLAAEVAPFQPPRCNKIELSLPTTRENPGFFLRMRHDVCGQRRRKTIKGTDE